MIENEYNIIKLRYSKNFTLNQMSFWLSIQKVKHFEHRKIEHCNDFVQICFKIKYVFDGWKNFKKLIYKIISRCIINNIINEKINQIKQKTVFFKIISQLFTNLKIKVFL